MENLSIPTSPASEGCTPQLRSVLVVLPVWYERYPDMFACYPPRFVTPTHAHATCTHAHTRTHAQVFGLMIDQRAAAEDYSAAYELMQEMRDRIPKVNIAYYVNMRVIEVQMPPAVP